jgi:hypothetical protein
VTKSYAHPIRRVTRAQGRSLVWLARETGISYGYLMQILLPPDSPRHVDAPGGFYSRVAHLLGVAESQVRPSGTNVRFPEGATAAC